MQQDDDPDITGEALLHEVTLGRGLRRALHTLPGETQGDSIRGVPQDGADGGVVMEVLGGEGRGCGWTLRKSSEAPKMGSMSHGSCWSVALLRGRRSCLSTCNSFLRLRRWSSHHGSLVRRGNLRLQVHKLMQQKCGLAARNREADLSLWHAA